MNNETRDALSIHWTQIATFLVVAAVFLVLAVHATRRVLRRYSPQREVTLLVVWIAVIWLLPVLGPLLAMSAAESGSNERSVRHDQSRSA